MAISATLLRRRGRRALLSGFTPVSLFSAGQDGIALIGDRQAALGGYSDTDPMGTLYDTSGNGNDLTQATATLRPLYRTSPARILPDFNDDSMEFTPSVTDTYGACFAHEDGVFIMDLSLTASTAVDLFNTHNTWGTTSAGTVGVIIREGAFTADERDSLQTYFEERGAPSTISATYAQFFRDRSELTVLHSTLPTHDTDFTNSFLSSGLTDVPDYDWNQATVLKNTFNGSALSSHPDFGASAAGNCESVLSFTSVTEIPATVDYANATKMFKAYFNSSLVTVPSGVFTCDTCTDYDRAFQGCALTEASVDNILADIDAAGASNGTLHLDGGTSSAPSAAGDTSKANLQARGWTVVTN